MMQGRLAAHGSCSAQDTPGSHILHDQSTAKVFHLPAGVSFGQVDRWTMWALCQETNDQGEHVGKITMSVIAAAIAAAATPSAAETIHLSCNLPSGDGKPLDWRIALDTDRDVAAIRSSYGDERRYPLELTESTASFSGELGTTPSTMPVRPRVSYVIDRTSLAISRTLVFGASRTATGQCKLVEAPPRAF